MDIKGARSVPNTPAFLPIRQSRRGSGFSESLRAQIRTAGTRSMAGKTADVTPPPPAASGRVAALQQSLLISPPRTAAASDWAGRAQSIGQEHLPPEAADVFVRQMSLESLGFDPDVITGRRVSAAGAEGIAQLMPSSYPHVNRLDPVASLNAAAATMRANLQTFGGDLRKALAAYNAGGGRVAQAVARSGAAWETDLPAETKLYLRELLGGVNG